MSTITWRNVDGPDNRTALSGLLGAGESINTAFNQFNKVIEARQIANQNALNRQDAAGILAAREMLSTAKTPEEAMARESQVIADTQGLSIKARTDALALAGARRDDLYKSIKGEQTYATDTRNYEQLNRVAPLDNQVAYEAAVQKAETNPEVLLQKTNDIWHAAKKQELNQIQDIKDLQQKGRTTDFNIANLPATQEATLANQNLTKLQTAANTVTAVEAKDTKDVVDFATQKTAEYETEKRTNQDKYAYIAKQIGIPVDNSGSINLSTLNPEQINLLKKTGKDLKYPDFDSVFGGDTANFKKVLNESRNKFGAVATQRAIGTIAQQANGQEVPLIGEDAKAAALKVARLDEADRLTNRDNWFAPGSENATNAYKDLAPWVSTIFKGSDMYEDEPDIQSLLGKAATVGLNVGTKSKPLMVTPPKNIMQAAVLQHTGNWNILNKERAKDIEETAILMMVNAGVEKKLAAAADSDQLTSARNIRNALYPKAPAK